MVVALTDYLQERQEQFNKELVKVMEQVKAPERLRGSMIYSLTAGGKRLRPILMMASCESFGGNLSLITSSSIAVELIHTYSLIHDDLPSMDNDDVRRGKPTNHKMFDEATAVLAGDGLLTYSFELIASDDSLTYDQRVFLINQLAHAAGPMGMVAGQMEDMKAEKEEVDLSTLEQIHALKTGQLIKFAILAGAYLGGATNQQLTSINDFAYYLGLIFQVQDDILDVTGDPELIGKPVGSDESNSKSTFPSLLGMDGAIKQKEKYVNLAKQSLKKAGIRHSVLEELTDYLSSRNH
ncbi:polyprenyl synthetase family protein [Aquibacillus salsiterrae]|uniref:Farnesyl diphosphate synthase n=1 Tax=Aquibacillus salsiterrae TaxID=2950439 RepID=A0A9X4ADN8_9BACI|nr:farnesyl diphosphate synthase [Aquibacillus salsiterrae]MDC3415479.1 polyprenyl synthetase family protein [Aquibacillus salsiterrae]